jgi:hypothetical protein
LFREQNGRGATEPRQSVVTTKVSPDWQAARGIAQPWPSAIGAVKPWST